MKRLTYFNNAVLNKLCFLLPIVLSTGCSDDLEIEKQTFNETYFSPPSWIIGTWKEPLDDQQEYVIVRSFEFTASNFIVNPLAEEIHQIDFNAYINEMRSFFNDLETDIKVVKTGELYQLSISPPLVTDNYTFEKVDDNTIICTSILGVGPEEGQNFILKRFK
jgi:hypothetical protein